MSLANETSFSLGYDRSKAVEDIFLRALLLEQVDFTFVFLFFSTVAKEL